MNLYELRFRHYAQKDNKEGIICYLLAENNEQIYDFIRSEPTIKDGSKYDISIYVSWMYKDDPENEEFEKDFKDRIINCNGEMYDDEAEIADLYYGLTHYGWNFVYKDISKEQISILKKVGIIVTECK